MTISENVIIYNFPVNIRIPANRKISPAINIHVYYLYLVKSSNKNNEVRVHSTYFCQQHARV